MVPLLFITYLFIFVSVLLVHVNRHAPLKKLKPKEAKLQQKPWISKELIKMIKIRNRLSQRKKRQPNNLNVIIYLEIELVGKSKNLKKILL